MVQSEKRSKARMVMNRLLSEFSQNRVSIGEMLPSESELMERFSVSRTTVRQALAELTNQGLIVRKQGLGSFRSLPRAENRRTERSMLIGVWFNWPSGPLYGPMAEAIQQELSHYDCHAVFEGGLSTGDQGRGIRTLMHKGLDGFIVSPSSDPGESHAAILRMHRDGMPLVLLDKRIDGCETDLVTTNNRLGAEQLVEHLIDLGHRRIAYVGTAGVSTVTERLHGYRIAMRRRGLPIRPEWVGVSEDVFADYGAATAKKLLALPADVRPTAIFATNDPIAETIAKVAHKIGLRVPEQLSLVGFDDAGFGSELEPWLTTYAQPKIRLGQQAAELLMRRISEPEAPRETILLEGQLIIRRSTAPASK